MHLVADSGSTKTEWRIVHNNDYHLLSNGLNPMVAPIPFLEMEIKNVAAHQNNVGKITRISFYGAGCAKNESKETIKGLLERFFPKANVEVYSDLIAAAKAVFNTTEGISCILGTGSNAAYYDGKNLVQDKPALGYILGDDGAGVGIGRALLKDYLYGNTAWLPFIKYLSLESDPKEIIRAIYANDKPNTLIAQYAEVALKNLSNPMIQKLVRNQFNQFFDDMVEPYRGKSRKVGFVGSVAHYGSEILNEICKDRNMELYGIVKQPIENIIKQLES